MKLIFAGTPEFAAQALQALLDAGHDISLVLTRSDKPAGRGQQVVMSPVKQLALKHGIQVSQPRTLRPGVREEAVMNLLASQQADAMIVAAYGLILPADVLALPRFGCLNIHASLLPRWRGAAPIQRAIQAGDAQTGITIMQMDEGLDTGPMRLIKSLPIHPNDNASAVHDRLAVLGGLAMVEALDLLQAGQLAMQAQPAQGVCFADKLDKAEGQLDWPQPAISLANKIRAFNPVPGSFFVHQGAAIKVWAASVYEAADLSASATPGQVVGKDAKGLLLSTGGGVLRLEVLQKPGGKRLDAAAFLAGYALPEGTLLE